MKKLTVLILTLLISYSSYGKWQEIIKTTKDIVYYINPDSITRFDDSFTIKVLKDFPKPQPYGYRSIVTSTRGNCKAYTLRYEKASYHQSPMGRHAPLWKGSVIKATKELKKGSIGGAIIDYVCNFDKKGKNQNKKTIYIPPNAYASGSGWLCNKGYTKIGNYCLKDKQRKDKTTSNKTVRPQVPKNAFSPFGTGWECRSGYTKKGNECVAKKKATEQQRKDKTTSNKTISDFKKDLEAIKDLLDSELITKEDYDKQKQKILDRM